MRVVGTTAYISTVIKKTFDAQVGKVGDRAVLWVKEGGAKGVDVAYGGPASWDPTDAMCTSTPPRLPETPVADGKITVR